MTRRTEMLGSTIQRELAEMILRDLQDPRLTGLPSVTRVKVSPDLSIADVYITVMGTDGQQTAALNALKHAAGLMRTKLTKVLSVRQAPFLKFHIDESLKKELAVLDAIRKARQEDEARAAASGLTTPESTDEAGEEPADESAAQTNDGPQDQVESSQTDNSQA